MIQPPRPQKAQRDLTGLLTVTFHNMDDGKEFTKAFTELRAGVSWPIRSIRGYMCILGVLAGKAFGKENSLMLVYESDYPDSLELMTDAYNRAHDLRFQTFYTDRQKLDWKGFNFDFERKIRGGLGGRDIRLKHSPFAGDFVLGKDTIRRIAGQKAFFDLPRASLLVDQLSNIQPEDMDTDHPEYKFHAINAFRYLLVAWSHENSPAAKGLRDERQTTVMGWA